MIVGRTVVPLNLVANGSFETNTTGWGVSSATIARSTVRAKFGTASALLTATATNGDSRMSSPFALGIRPLGTPYAASFWMYGEGSIVGRGFQALLWESGGATGPSMAGQANPTILAGWNRYTVAGALTKPDRTTLNLYIGGVPGHNWASGEYVYVDGIQVEVGTIAHDYDGDGVLVAGSLNTKVVSRYTFPDVPTKIAKLSIYLDGLGAAANQVARAVAYRTDGTLAAVGDEVTILGEQAAGWMDFPFAGTVPAGVVVLADEQLDLGLHFGASGGTARVRAVASGTGMSNTSDTYSDGTAATYGTATSTGQELVLFASAFQPWLPPREVDYWYASLPFPEAQARLGVTGIIRGARRVQGGWHHTQFDPALGSYAIVRTEGPLAGMVGERIKITERSSGQQRQVNAYVHREAEINEDLSLPRRLFAELALLPENEITMDVEVYS